jgi:hypothetical protein
MTSQYQGATGHYEQIFGAEEQVSKTIDASIMRV